LGVFVRKNCGFVALLLIGFSSAQAEERRDVNLHCVRVGSSQLVPESVALKKINTQEPSIDVPDAVIRHFSDMSGVVSIVFVTGEGKEFYFSFGKGEMESILQGKSALIKGTLKVRTEKTDDEKAIKCSVVPDAR
jgi:hypothetical protein